MFRKTEIKIKIIENDNTVGNKKIPILKIFSGNSFLISWILLLDIKFIKLLFGFKT